MNNFGFPYVSEGIIIGIFLVVSLVIWRRKQLNAWFDFEERGGDDNEAE